MRARRAMSQINVVPYIDVMLVLLVIFMVAAPMLPTGSVDLPSVGKGSPPPSGPSAPLEVVVKSDGSLALRDRATNTPERNVSRAELAQAIAEASKGTERPVLIAGDKTVPYDAVLQVMDVLQSQKVKRIGLLVHPTGK